MRVGGEFHPPFATSYRHACDLCDQILRYIPERHHFAVRTTFKELMANAVKATTEFAGLEIRMEFELKGDKLTLEIVNQGVRFVTNPHTHRMPPITGDHVRGRGIPLAALCTDYLYYVDMGCEATCVIAGWNLKSLRVAVA